MEIIIKGRKLRKRGIAVIAVFLIAMSMISFKMVNASEPVESDEPVVIVDVDEIEGFEIVERLIKEDDTAWDIQYKLTPDEDIEDLLSELEVINNKDLEEIKPGETIKFAKERD